MHHKIVRVFAILFVLIFCLSACKTESDRSDKTAGTSVKHETVAQPVIPQGDPIREGETVRVEDVGAFTVESVQITDDIVPPSPASFYSHYPAEDGRTYVDVCFSYQNLRTEDVKSADVFSAELLASGQYRYKGHILSEEDGRSDFAFLYVTVIPLATEYIHCAFELPEAVAQSDCSLIASIEVDKKAYVLTVREGTERDLSAAFTENAENRLSGEISADASVCVPNSCVITLESAQFKRELRPRNPGSYVSYYKAEDGKTYFDVCIRYCSLSTESVNADKKISAKMTYAGKYEYDCKTFTEKADGSSVDQAWTISVEPLCTETIHLLFEVPEMIEQDSGPVTVSLTVDRASYTINVR